MKLKKLPMTPAMTVLAATLLGCASPEQVAQGQPFEVADSNATPLQIKECLIKPIPIMFRVTKKGAGYIVAQMTPSMLGPQGQEPIVWAAEITPTNNGSHVAFFRNYGELHKGQWSECLEPPPK